MRLGVVAIMKYLISELEDCWGNGSKWSPVIGSVWSARSYINLYTYILHTKREHYLLDGNWIKVSNYSSYSYMYLRVCVHDFSNVYMI